jgi:hypothetical protein
MNFKNVSTFEEFKAEINYLLDSTSEEELIVRLRDCGMKFEEYEQLELDFS